MLSVNFHMVYVFQCTHHLCRGPWMPGVGPGKLRNVRNGVTWDGLFELTETHFSWLILEKRACTTSPSTQLPRPLTGVLAPLGGVPCSRPPIACGAPDDSSHLPPVLHAASYSCQGGGRKSPRAQPTSGWLCTGVGTAGCGSTSDRHVAVAKGPQRHKESGEWSGGRVMGSFVLHTNHEDPIFNKY